jgi:hypothetical protein
MRAVATGNGWWKAIIFMLLDRMTGKAGGISYPHVTVSHPQPFRYLGRKLPLAAWKNKDATAQYLQTLTAVGYGEPTFAAFYPNCLSVFGFHDDAPPRSLEAVQYDVIGWYSDPRQDCLHSEALQEAFAKEKYSALEEVYRWVVEHPSGSPLPPFPTKTICYAHLTFDPDDTADDLPEERKVAVAVGNTGTEALSAYLADLWVRKPKLAKQRPQIPNPAVLEDQLEAIHLAGQLDGRTLDIGPKFREARHNKEFNGVMAGTLWTIRLEKTASGQANAHEAATYAEDTLPPELATQLDLLNLRQQAFDRDCDEIESLRKQLLADWYKYMLCVYPPEGNRDQYPNHDEVKYFIEKNDLIPLQQRIAKNEALNDQCHQAYATLYRAVAELQLLTTADIADWANFQKRFQAPRSAQAEHLSKLLSDGTKSLLSTQTGPLNEESQKQTIRDLNSALKNARLYESTVFGSLALSGEAQSLAEQLTKATIKDWPVHQILRFNRLLLEAIFPEEIAKSAPYALKSAPAPRYWQPNEPVVLIVDEEEQTVRPTPRHGRDVGLRHEDGLLKCDVIQLPDAAIDQHLEDIRSKIIGLKPGLKEIRTGFSIWTGQPWHPFLLEWEVELMPLKGKYQRSTDDDRFPVGRAYDPDCIIESYQLNEDDVDLVIQPGRETLAKESNLYYGRSILTPYAKLQLINQIEKFLEKQLLENYYSSQSVKLEERTDNYFAENIGTIIAWYESPERDKKDTFLEQILPVYKYVRDGKDDDSGFHLLAQSLSGFNEALLMQKQTFQLPIGDPLGFADYQPFTEAVRVAVGRSNRTAPQPHNDFNPIRTGVLKFNQLRLVDTFGQVQTLNLQDNQVIRTHVMTTPANRHLVILPPRIVQPARLNFRWLAGDDDFALEESDDPEMNSHPVSTPICGWLLPNNLDNSLMVYDAQGRALGSLNRGGRWEPAPGGQRSLVPWPLPNPHLHRMATYLQEREMQSAGFLDAFLTVIEKALENIDPEYAGGHEALSLLMGRPMAVARASLNLEVQGYPAIDQDWNVFRQDMERAFPKESEDRNRETKEYTEVKIPIRIGEYKQLNDGLVGYWIEEEGEYKGKMFYAPQTGSETDLNHPSMVIHRDDQPLNITQSIKSPPTKLTLLLDPRGAVHATSGFLPTKAIQIPAEQFVEALKNIEVTFLTAPILTDRGKINLSLPDEPGYVWSWCEKENGAWDRVTKIGQGTTEPTAAPQELREGWLKLTKKDRP